MTEKRHMGSDFVTVDKVSQAKYEASKANHGAFMASCKDFGKEDWGKCALMHDAKLQAVFTTAKDADLAGKLAFGEGKFSIEMIVQVPGIDDIYPIRTSGYAEVVGRQ